MASPDLEAILARRRAATDQSLDEYDGAATPDTVLDRGKAFACGQNDPVYQSMDDKRALFGSRSGVPHRHPESPEGKNLAFNHHVSGTLPSAELRHRPIPCLRSSSKEKESVVLDFGRTETSSSQTTRASPHNAAMTPKTRSPDLTFLKQNLRRLYD